jgi:hypothetical protein
MIIVPLVLLAGSPSRSVPLLFFKPRPGDVSFLSVSGLANCKNGVDPSWRCGAGSAGIAEMKEQALRRRDISIQGDVPQRAGGNDV